MISRFAAKTPLAGQLINKPKAVPKSWNRRMSASSLNETLRIEA
jgi:hypothetical protein